MVGPRQGGTLVTIEGRNLVLNFDDEQSSVTIAGVPCVPVESQYDAVTLIHQVVCRTGTSENIKSGPVSITISDTTVRDSSNTDFSYVASVIQKYLILWKITIL